jgi:hypothetical protein
VIAIAETKRAPEATPSARRTPTSTSRAVMLIGASALIAFSVSAPAGPRARAADCGSTTSATAAEACSTPTEPTDKDADDSTTGSDQATPAAAGPGTAPKAKAV